MIPTLVILSLLAQAEPAPGSCSVEGKLTLLDPSGKPTAASEAVLYVKNGPPRARPEPKTHVVLQKNQQFSPRSLVVMVNDRVDFVNQDATTHSVFSRLGKDPFTGDVNNRATTFSRTFVNQGHTHVQCNIHKKMSTDILVLRSDAFARPDAEGRFRITGLDRAAYTLVVWEPNGQELEVQVAACGKLGPVELVHTQKAPPHHLRRDNTDYPPPDWNPY